MSLVKTPEVLDADSRADRRIDPQLELLAHWMDTVFEVPALGVRFGLDAIIGLIPGLGDLITSLISLYILAAARRYGVPRATLMRMATNIAIDSVAGAVPLVGDVFDVFWKANKKNVALLRRHVYATPVEQRSARRKDTLFVAAIIVGLLLLMAVIGVAVYSALAWLVHRLMW